MELKSSYIFNEFLLIYNLLGEGMHCGYTNRGFSA